MIEILNSIGTLLLGSLPTITLFLILVLAYQFLVQGPLTRTLAERHARTEGAVEKARAAIESADAKTQEYEAKIRAARAEVMKAREQRVRQWNAERDAALEKARQAAQERVAQAKKAIEAEASEARRTIEAQADQIAEQILNAILPGRVAAAESTR